MSVTVRETWLEVAGVGGRAHIMAHPPHGPKYETAGTSHPYSPDDDTHLMTPTPPLDDASGLVCHRREPDLPARRLVVLLHGYGANGADLEGMEARYAERVADAVWLRPEAPHGVIDGLSDAQLAALKQVQPDVDFARRRSWAAALAGSQPAGTDPSALDIDAALAAAAGPVEEALESAVAALNTLIDGELARLDLDDSALAICGFSQGGMAALHTALSRPSPCAAVVSHSGQFYGRSDVGSTPPALLLAGEKEMVEGKPGSVIFPWSVEALKRADVDIEFYIARGLGHGSSRRSDVVISRFMERAFQERGR